MDLQTPETLTRSEALAPASLNREAGTVDVILSTGAAVRRAGYVERLVRCICRRCRYGRLAPAQGGGQYLRGGCLCLLGRHGKAGHVDHFRQHQDWHCR